MREIPASELIRSLLDGVPSKVFDFVRIQEGGEKTVSKIRVKLLRLEENDSVLADSQAHAKHRKESEQYTDIYREAQAVELLTRALCHVDKHTRPDGTSYYPPLFTDSRQVRASFTATELSVLLNCFQIVKSEYGTLETLDEHDADMWTERFSDPLKAPFWLSQLDCNHYPGAILLLAAQVRDLRTEVGRPLSTSPDSSEFNPEISTSDTGISIEQPVASSENDPEPIKAGELMTQDEARKRVTRVTKPKK